MAPISAAHTGRFRPARVRSVLTLAAACLVVPVATVSGFEVVRNVNDPEPPKDRTVIFEAGEGHEHLTFDANPHARATFNDAGELVVHLTGTEEALIRIGWKAGDGRPEAIRFEDHSGLRLVCRAEGSAEVTNRKGTKTETQPIQESGGIQLRLWDGGGHGFWVGSLSHFAPGEKNPTEMADVLVHFTLVLVPEEGDTDDIRAIQFRMPPRGWQDRDYRLVIRKIAFTE